MKLLKSTLLGVAFGLVTAGVALAAGPCCKEGSPCCEKKDGKLPPCCDQKAAPKPGDQKPAPSGDHQH